MIENKERLKKGKDLIRFFLGQAKNNLEQAKMQCLFIHPNWRMIEDGIQETIAQINGILETSQKPDEDEKFPPL
jgi:hypothetical protein